MTRTVVPRDRTWPPARLDALTRDGGVCQRCGDPATAVHHRRVRGMGGGMDDPTRHRPDRLVALCGPCHRWVHGNPFQAKAGGWIVPRPQRTEDTPVKTRSGWLLLAVDGSTYPVAS